MSSARKENQAVKGRPLCHEQIYLIRKYCSGFLHLKVVSGTNFQELNLIIGIGMGLGPEFLFQCRFSAGSGKIRFFLQGHNNNFGDIVYRKFIAFCKCFFA